jgi:hypothetical protein
MPGVLKVLGGAIVLFAMAATSLATVVVVDYSPEVRDGGFESYAGNGPTEFWTISNGNPVGHASELGFAGPANPSEGSAFAVLYSQYNGVDTTHDLGQADGKFRSTTGPNPPFNDVVSVTLSFDYSLSGTVNGNTNSDLVLFNSANTDHVEYKTPLAVSVDPTVWTHVDLTFTDFTGEFGPLADIGQIRLDFNVRGTGLNDAVLNLDAVRLTFTTAALPEPASVAALGLSSLGLLMRRRAKVN